MEVVAERVSFAEEDEVDATTRPMGERVSYADDEASSAASGALVFDGAVEGEEFEMDALDVGAVEEEDTGGEEAAGCRRVGDEARGPDKRQRRRYRRQIDKKAEKQCQQQRIACLPHHRRRHPAAGH